MAVSMVISVPFLHEQLGITHDGNKLPFSVQPAILFKVDPMSVIALRDALNPSRSSITGRVNGAG